MWDRIPILSISNPDRIGILSHIKGSIFQIRIAPVGDEHMPRFVSDEQWRLRFHRHGLRSDAACPKNGDLAGANFDGLAKIGFGDIADADGFGIANVDRSAVST